METLAGEFTVSLNGMMPNSYGWCGIAEPLAKTRNVVICSQLPSAPPRLLIDMARMKQVLINVMTNAIQASEENQTILVKCYRENRNILIDVIDHGSGIPDEKREQIFLPFFTTKRGGSGLGLPITKKIIEAHQGQLKILDNPDTEACHGPDLQPSFCSSEIVFQWD